MCRVFSCVRHGSSSAEKWTSVSPWTAANSATALGATAPGAAEDRYTANTAPQVLTATGKAGGGGGGSAGLGDSPLLGLGGDHSG